MRRLFSFLPASINWRKLFIALIISGFGDKLTMFALMAKVALLNGKMEEQALIMICQAIPGFIVSPIAGYFADRFPKRNILIISEFSSALTILVIAFVPSYQLLVLTTIIHSIFSSIFGPVEASFEPEIIRESDLQRANSIRAGAYQGIDIIGPAISGAILGTIGFYYCFIIDSFTYLISGLLICSIVSKKSLYFSNFNEQVVKEKNADELSIGEILYTNFKSFSSEIKQGLVVIFKDYYLKITLLVQIMIILLMGLQGPLLIDYVHTFLHRKTESYSVLMISLGLGSLFGSFIIGSLKALNPKKMLNTLLIILFFDAICLYLFSISSNFFLSCLFMFFMGIISAAVLIFIRTILQTCTEKESRGKAFGTFYGIYSPFYVFSLCIPILLGEIFSSKLILQFTSFLEAVIAVLLIVFFYIYSRKKINNEAKYETKYETK